MQDQEPVNNDVQEMALFLLKKTKAKAYEIVGGSNWEKKLKDGSEFFRGTKQELAKLPPSVDIEEWLDVQYQRYKVANDMLKSAPSDEERKRILQELVLEDLKDSLDTRLWLYKNLPSSYVEMLDDETISKFIDQLLSDVAEGKFSRLDGVFDEQKYAVLLARKGTRAQKEVYFQTITRRILAQAAIPDRSEEKIQFDSYVSGRLATTLGTVCVPDLGDERLHWVVEQCQKIREKLERSSGSERFDSFYLSLVRHLKELDTLPADVNILIEEITAFCEKLDEPELAKELFLMKNIDESQRIKVLDVLSSGISEKRPFSFSKEVFHSLLSTYLERDTPDQLKAALRSFLDTLCQRKPEWSNIVMLRSYIYMVKETLELSTILHLYDQNPDRDINLLLDEHDFRSVMEEAYKEADTIHDQINEMCKLVENGDGSAHRRILNLIISEWEAGGDKSISRMLSLTDGILIDLRRKRLAEPPTNM